MGKSPGNKKFPQKKPTVKRDGLRALNLRSFGAFLKQHGDPPQGSFQSQEAKYVAPDIVIIIATDKEYGYLASRLKGKLKPIPDDDTKHSEVDFELQVDSNRTLRAKLVRLGKAGEVRACAILLRVIWKLALARAADKPDDSESLRTPFLSRRDLPMLIVNLGISATMHKNARLCDVIVASEIIRYMENQKCVDQEDKKGFTFEPRVDSDAKIDGPIVNQVKYAINSDQEAFVKPWREECHNIAQSEFTPEKLIELEKAQLVTSKDKLELMTEKLLSGPLLLNSSIFKKALQKADGAGHALDMESGGFAWGWQAIPSQHKPNMIVIRGISDHGDGTKDNTDGQTSESAEHHQKTSVGNSEKIDPLHGVPPDAFRKVAMLRAWETMIQLLRAGLHDYCSTKAQEQSSSQH